MNNYLQMIQIFGMHFKNNFPINWSQRTTPLYAASKDSCTLWCKQAREKRMVERVKEKAHIHSLTADGDEQQKCSRYPGNKAAATFQNIFKWFK